MVPLAFGFVVGSVGPCVEGAAFGRAREHRGVLYLVERREFGAVVAQAGLERIWKARGYQLRHHGDDRLFGRRRVAFLHQPPDLQVEPGEGYREYRHFVVPFADDGIVLGDDRPFVGGGVVQEVAVRPPDEGADVADDDLLRLGRFGEVPFEPNVSAKLVRLHGEGAGIDEPPERPLAADLPRPFVRDEDVVDRPRVPYLLGKRVQFGDVAGRNPGSGPRFPPPSPRFCVGGLVVVKPLFEPAIGPFAAEVAYAEAPNLRALAGAGVPDLGSPLDFPVDGGDREADPLGDRRRGFALRDASLYQHSVVDRQFGVFAVLFGHVLSSFRVGRAGRKNDNIPAEKHGPVVKAGKLCDYFVTLRFSYAMTERNEGSFSLYNRTK